MYCIDLSDSSGCARFAQVSQRQRRQQHRQRTIRTRLRGSTLSSPKQMGQRVKQQRVIGIPQLSPLEVQNSIGTDATYQWRRNYRYVSFVVLSSKIAKKSHHVWLENVKNYDKAVVDLLLDYLHGATPYYRINHVSDNLVYWSLIQCFWI